MVGSIYSYFSDILSYIDGNYCISILNVQNFNFLIIKYYCGNRLNFKMTRDDEIIVNRK